MNSLGSVIGILGGICGILVLVAGAWVNFKGSYNKARLEALREDLGDYRDRVNQLESKEIIQSKDIQRLSSENDLLKGLVTQRAQVEQVLEELSLHHAEAMRQWEGMNEILRKMEENSKELSPEMHALALAVGKLTR